MWSREQKENERASKPGRRMRDGGRRRVERDGGEEGGCGRGKRGEAELIEIRASRAAGLLLLLLGAQGEHAQLLEFFF